MKNNVTISEYGKLTVYKSCPICNGRHFCRVRCTTEQRIDYELNYNAKRVKPIQDIFPGLSKQQREFLKSGTCRQCQKELF